MIPVVNKIVMHIEVHCDGMDKVFKISGFQRLKTRRTLSPLLRELAMT